MNDRYISPLGQRYASEEMQRIFSNDKKFHLWRRLWIALAESEKELGLAITQEQIDELKAHAEDINYDVARGVRNCLGHDVMSCDMPWDAAVAKMQREIGLSGHSPAFLSKITWI